MSDITVQTSPTRTGPTQTGPTAPTRRTRDGRRLAGSAAAAPRTAHREVRPALAVVRACRAGARRLLGGLERLGRETGAAAARGLTP